jgi:hypothetical protein
MKAATANNAPSPSHAFGAGPFLSQGEREISARLRFPLPPGEGGEAKPSRVRAGWFAGLVIALWKNNPPSPSHRFAAGLFLSQWERELQ